MVMTLTQASEVGRLAKVKGVMVMPVFQNRFNKATSLSKTTLALKMNWGKCV